MVIRLAIFIFPLLLSFTTVEPFPFPFFNNKPWFRQPTNPQSLDLDSLIPRLFAPTRDQKPFVAQKPKDLDGGEYGGEWEIVSQNAGVSAMHLIIRPNNKAIMFDTFVYGPSAIQLPAGNCRQVPNRPDDCWAHGVEFDLKTAAVRPLKLLTDPWCSAGGLSPDGTLISSGGWFDGTKSVRTLPLCPTCDFQESPTALAAGERWYSTQQILPDGGFILIGGRRAFSYEYIPPPGKTNTQTFPLDFLRQTTDPAENNLYPFVHLIPDGNLFIFANNIAILLNPKTSMVVKTYPLLPGGSRNYPPSGMSALLPLDLRTPTITSEVIVCGGGSPLGMDEAAKNNFLPALKSCGRLSLDRPKPRWKVEDMPMARIMGDMLILPNGEILIINGAASGVSGWWFARDPVLEPVLYKPKAAMGSRFSILTGTDIPRVYHSTSAVLPDATVLVAGSNTNNAYNFTNVLFPTELRVEKFRPPYFDPSRAQFRPSIEQNSVPRTVTYGGVFTVEFAVPEGVMKVEDLMVTMYSPPFTTHGFSQGQRLLILKTSDLTANGFDRFMVSVAVPTSRAVAPPGYYLVYVVNDGIPSEGEWVRIQ